MEKIEPVYVTYEQAKWLKDIGFDALCEGYYDASNLEEYNYIVQKGVRNSHFIFGMTAPEQWQVIEWLRVNHGIWVYSECDVYGEYWFPKILPCSKTVWANNELREKIEEFTRHRNLFYKTPKEANSAAFDFIITNNLI
jgi:predicted oxidoreductase